MSTIDRHYDAHCHLFNKDYLFRELAAIFIKCWHRGRSVSAEKGFRISTDITRIKEVLKWVNELGVAIEGDEEAHFTFLKGVASEAWGDHFPVKLVPLMMDIFYMFDDPVYAQQKVAFKPCVHDKSLESNDEVLAELEAALMDVGVDPKKAKRITKDTVPIFAKGLDDAPLSCDYSKGFDRHRIALAKLQGKYPESVLPFFAVDPRRSGVVQAVLKGDFVGKGKSFRGVKLYPRLGYHPCCTDLEPLFAWCDENRVPIITHCGPSGFPPFNDKYSDFGAPCSFRKVLEKHSSLIIDFAHFGTGKICWADEIVTLMDQHENVFADLACYEEAAEIVQFKNAYWTLGKVQDRTMFGTDYSMMYFFKTVSLASYYSNFGNIFATAELTHMDEVAAHFLDI